jgi:lysozyme family protein
MADFLPAFDFMIKHEGGILEDSNTGEVSNFGITQYALNIIRYKILDPKLLTLADAQNIYYSEYWQRSFCASINSQAIANKFFDMCVNMGSWQATRLLQASLNSVGGSCVIDGQVGPHTIIVMNGFLQQTESENRLLEELRIKCVTFYTVLGNKEKYKKRANDIGYEVQAGTLRDSSQDKIVKG